MILKYSVIFLFFCFSNVSFGSPCAAGFLPNEKLTQKDDKKALSEEIQKLNAEQFANLTLHEIILGLTFGGILMTQAEYFTKHQINNLIHNIEPVLNYIKANIPDRIKPIEKKPEEQKKSKPRKKADRPHSLTSTMIRMNIEKIEPENIPLIPLIYIKDFTITVIKRLSPEQIKALSPEQKKVLENKFSGFITSKIFPDEDTVRALQSIISF